MPAYACCVERWTIPVFSENASCLNLPKFTTVCALQYGLVPTHGMPLHGSSDATPTRSHRQRIPSQREWEDTIFAILYLRQAVSKLQLKRSTDATRASANESIRSPLKAEKERRSKEFQLKMDEVLCFPLQSAYLLTSISLRLFW